MVSCARTHTTPPPPATSLFTHTLHTLHAHTPIAKKRLVIAFCGWILVLAGLSALQNYVNVSRSSENWWAAGNKAFLSPYSIFRLDWWVWIYTLATVIIGTLAFASNVVSQSRIALVSWSAIGAVLTMISGNNMLDVAAQNVSPAHTSAARCAAAGFIIAAISFLALCYNVGIDPSKAPN